MTEQLPFVLNKNVDRENVLHRFPAFEQCNLDDAAKLEHIDAETADALINMGEARRCEHCFSG